MRRFQIFLWFMVSGGLSFSAYAELQDSDLETFFKPETKLTLTNAFFKQDGVAIQGVKFSLDAAWSEKSCTADDRNGDGKTCGESFSVEPGSHVLAVTYCEKSDCSRFGKIWNSTLRFTVGKREEAVIDLKALAEWKTPEQIARIINRKAQAAQSQSSCAKALDDALGLDMCQSSVAPALVAALTAATKVCGNAPDKRTDSQFEGAALQFRWLEPTRCYNSDEIKKLPGFLVKSAPSSFWPPGTLAEGKSSWLWAREHTVKGPENLSHKPLWAALIKSVEDWRARQEVVDQLIAAVLNPEKNLKPLVQLATAHPEDINPTHVPGHRLFGLSVLANVVPKIGSDKAVSALFAKSTATISKIHCAFLPEAEHILDSLVADKEVSTEDWKAVKQMIDRTPAGKSLRACAVAAMEKASAGVSLEERARYLAKADCSKERDPEFRGKTINYLVDASFRLLPVALRIKITKEFPNCIE